MLEVDIREKRYPAQDGSEGLLAVKDLAFEVKSREFVCLMGPSGCGKSTSLRIILGLDDDYEGALRFASGAKPRMGAMFQEPRLLPWRTVEENIRLALPDALKKPDLDALMGALGLTGMENFYPGALSLGLARRVAMARAFAVEPSLLILDEPFVSLDEETAARLRALLITVWRARPAAGLMVTHHLREALELASRIILLTPRPASVRGVIEIDTPRPARKPQWLRDQAEKIAFLYPGIV